MKQKERCGGITKLCAGLDEKDQGTEYCKQN